MPEKKLPTGPIRIDPPPPATKKDDPAIAPVVLLAEKHKHDLPTTIAQNPQKVSMRLSQEAWGLLKQFRADTGIPYEILVEVLVLHFHELPERTRKAYMDEAIEMRSLRLVAGQEKALETVKSKLKGRHGTP